MVSPGSALMLLGYYIPLDSESEGMRSDMEPPHEVTGFDRMN